jgi:hypothetical protein
VINPAACKIRRIVDVDSAGSPSRSRETVRASVCEAAVTVVIRGIGLRNGS